MGNRNELGHPSSVSHSFEFSFVTVLGGEEEEKEIRKMTIKNKKIKNN